MEKSLYIIMILALYGCSTSSEPVEMSAKSEFKPHYASPPEEVSQWKEVDLTGDGLLEGHLDTDYLESCDVDIKENVDYPRAYFSNTASTCSYSTD